MSLNFGVPKKAHKGKHGKEGRETVGPQDLFTLFYLFTFFPAMVAFSGCSEIATPTAHQAMTHPFGTQSPFVRGTTKEEIREAWGPPDSIVPLGVDELGTTREEWIYKGRVPSLPFDYEYVSRTKHLFFEGENLIRSRTDEPEMQKASSR